MRQLRWNREATTIGSITTGRSYAIACRQLTMANSDRSYACCRTIGAKASCTGETSTNSKRTWGLEMIPDSSGVDSGDVASTVRRLTASVMTSPPTAQDKFSGQCHRRSSPAQLPEGPSAPRAQLPTTPATALPRQGNSSPTQFDWHQTP